MDSLTERRVDEDSVVELCGRGGDVDGLHLLEGAERVALGHQLGDGPLVQRPRDQQDYVVDHVASGKTGYDNQIVSIDLNLATM